MKKLCLKRMIPGPVLRRNRVSFHGLKRGVLTAEAAFSFPVFFMIVICIASIMNLYGRTVDQASSLRDLTETAAAAADVSDETLWIDITMPDYFEPFFLPDGLAGVFIPARGRVRAWNGRSSEETKPSGTEEHYVYMTENGRVYHTRADCSHLVLSTHGVPYSQLESLRNSSGSRYKPCEKCCRHGTGSGFVYITDDGDRYHCTAECPGLKRSVRLVPESSVSDLPECSGCAASEGTQ